MPKDQIEENKPEDQKEEVKTPKVVHKEGVENKSNNTQEIKKGLVKEMSIEKPKSSKKTAINILISIVVVVAGIFSGWGLSQVVSGENSSHESLEARAKVSEDEISVGATYGKEAKEFTEDPVEGVLLKGGFEGEGSHRLLRPGGDTQTAYLTSSVLDLDPFENHKVRVWGETFGAQKVNWLMDVGRVEVLELDAEKPFVEDLE